MKLSEIIQTVEADVICGHNRIDAGPEVECACASDLMSDVLMLKRRDFMLITGLSNVQSIRTAEMSDVRVILYVRNKPIDPEIVTLAEENEMIILRTAFSMFRTVGLLYSAGLKPVY